MGPLSRRGQLAHQAILAVVGLFVLAPVWVLVLMATDGSMNAYPTEIRLFPADFTLDRFAAALEHPTPDVGFPGVLGNSLFVSGFAAGVSLFFGATMAYAFARMRFPGRDAGLVAVLLGAFLPPIALATPLFVLFITIERSVPALAGFGFPDSTLALAIVYASFALPLCVWLMRAAFRAVPADLEEAAFVDGASRFRAFRTITLPLAMPSILVAALVAFLLAYTEFALAWLFISSERNETLAMVLAASQTGFYTPNWGPTAAIGLLMILPVVIIFLALQRALLQGSLTGTSTD